MTWNLLPHGIVDLFPHGAFKVHEEPILRLAFEYGAGTGRWKVEEIYLHEDQNRIKVRYFLKEKGVTARYEWEYSRSEFLSRLERGFQDYYSRVREMRGIK